MPPKRIPGTDQIYWSNPHTGDRVINLKDYPELDPAVRNEDVVIIGRFTDYDGSGNRGPTEVMTAGIQDDLAGDIIAKAEGAEHEEVTNRGNRASTHRQRPRLVYVEN